MILAIDIGNTTTSFGVFEKGRLASQCSIATQPTRTPAKARASEGRSPERSRGDEITLQLKALAKTRKLHLARAKQIILCSVVPRMSAVLAESLHSLNAVPLRVVGQDVIVPLKNRYRYPEQVGQDRLVGAYAAWREFGDEARRGRPVGRNPERASQRESKDCIVADFGTAITIDVVTRLGEYLGGIIAPGLEISLDALATRTALLPKVELKEPPELLGRDTANSIRSGLLYGCVALCDGLVRQLKQQYAKQAVVIATGGSSPLIAKHARTIDHLRPHLVLEGLFHLASR